MSQERCVRVVGGVPATVTVREPTAAVKPVRAVPVVRKLPGAALALSMALTMVQASAAPL